MHVITRVYTDTSSNEATVICDNESFRITIYDYQTFRIEEGDNLDDEEFELLNSAAERLRCIKKAFDLLSYGDLSQKQLCEKLSRKFSKELSLDVSELLVERGYIDDLRLAKRYAETFYEFKNFGISRIKNELFKRGISKENIEIALEKYEMLDQSERIEFFITKKYDVTRLNDIKYRQKVYTGAIRAGFSSADIIDVIRTFESE